MLRFNPSQRISVAKVGIALLGTRLTIELGKSEPLEFPLKTFRAPVSGVCGLDKVSLMQINSQESQELHRSAIFGSYPEFHPRIMVRRLIWSIMTRRICFSMTLRKHINLHYLPPFFVSLFSIFLVLQALEHPLFEASIRDKSKEARANEFCGFGWRWRSVLLMKHFRIVRSPRQNTCPWILKRNRIWTRREVLFMASFDANLVGPKIGPKVFGFRGCFGSISVKSPGTRPEAFPVGNWAI